MGKRKKKIWCINQCDYCEYCMYYNDERYYFCDVEEYVLNPENEVNIKCKSFKTKSYSDLDMYNAMLNGYCEKMNFPYYGREIFLKELETEEQKKQKCMELGLIKGNDLKLIHIGDVIDSKIELVEDDGNQENLRANPEYLLWQGKVFKRDSYKCIICGSNKNINAHHLNSFSRYPDLRYIIDNGVTLCEEHHLTKCKGSFHNVYGTRNFTKEDFFEYKNNQMKEM